MLPPLPPYEALHPLAVHLPIGVLLVAWVPMLIGVLDRKRRHTWLACGAVMLLIGVASLQFAVMTGEAAERIVGGATQEISDAISAHEVLANRTRMLYILTVFLYMLAWLIYAKAQPKRERMVLVVGCATVAIIYTLALMGLINTGHTGGVLVHIYGVRAPIGR
ncbi:MAG: hypothetical protein JJ916_02755 [Phycisphaerales bacterium]|nr:hypothetical protein [Phycisphaerales bacterium]